MNRKRILRLMGVLLLVVVAAAAHSGRDSSPALAAGAVTVTGGANHTCAVTAGGGVKCWGWNWAYGILGRGTTGGEYYMPADVVGLESGVAAIDAGHVHTCALTTQGSLRCWGSNENGELGDGGASGSGSATPVEVCADSACNTYLSGVVGVSTSDGVYQGHTCALKGAGEAKCWGANADGQLGDGTVVERDAPVPVCADATCDTALSGVVAVEAGGWHTCALTEGGGVKCWGSNYGGALGNGTTTDSPTPVEVCADAACTGLLSGAVAISAAGDYSCALMADTGVKCWGSNQMGQLGNGEYETDEPTPVDVCADPSCTTPLSGVVEISAGGGDYNSHTCARTEGGGMKCWGSSYFGQLGIGWLETGRFTPVDVPGMTSGVVAIGSAYAHTCAVSADGAVSCWGLNYHRQLGTRTSMCEFWKQYLECSPTPVGVSGLGGPPDTDGDGCSDDAELGPDPEQGGLRNPKDFWDFYDTPGAANLRDKAVSGIDFFAVLGRFNAEGDPGLDPQLPAAPAPAYHTAFDRSTADGAFSGPPDGAISGLDFFLVLAQFNHSCQ